MATFIDQLSQHQDQWLELMNLFEMGFEYICGQDNMVPNKLSHYPKLANVIVVSLNLLDKIQAAQTAALGACQETLVSRAKVADGVLTMSDSLLCWQKGRLSTILIPKNLSLYKELLAQSYDIWFSGHFGP